jgi:hypothetical protein
MTDEEMEDIVELVYTEALALPDDLRVEDECTPADHELLRWAAGKLRARVSYQLSHIPARVEGRP